MKRNDWQSFLQNFHFTADGIRFVSTHRPGVGNSLPALSKFFGLNTSRMAVCAKISSSVKMKRISSFFSMPTPCSPVIDPPTAAHALRHSLPAASARSVSPGLLASNNTSGCKLPSPAWKIFAIRSPYLRLMLAISFNTSGSRLRGMTPSCTK